jgi:hypothetical protein
MSDIKNLFVDTFNGCDLSQFPVSDLNRLGFKRDIKEPKSKKQQVKRCPRITKSEDEKLFNRNKIIPIEPTSQPTKRLPYNKHFKNRSILEKMEAEKARHKIYYHTHREELKYKRLLKEGRVDVIKKLLSSFVD